MSTYMHSASEPTEASTQEILKAASEIGYPQQDVPRAFFYSLPDEKTMGYFKQICSQIQQRQQNPGMAAGTTTTARATFAATSQAGPVPPTLKQRCTAIITTALLVTIGVTIMVGVYIAYQIYQSSTLSE